MYRENPKDRSVLDEIVKSAKNGIRIISQMRELEGVGKGLDLKAVAAIY